MLDSGSPQARFQKILKTAYKENFHGYPPLQETSLISFMITITPPTLMESTAVQPLPSVTVTT